MLLMTILGLLFIDKPASCSTVQNKQSAG